MNDDTRTPKHALFWHVYAHVYDGIRFAMPYRKLLWDTYSNLNLQPGYRILDAGCGTGNFEHFLREKNAPRVAIEAVDFSPAMLARAKRKWSNEASHANFTLADLNAALDFPDSTFDRIVCLNVLYAVENPLFTLSEFTRVLKPGGVMIVANPRPNARFGPLIKDHFKRIRNVWGLRRRVFVLLKSIFMLGTTGVAPILLNVFVIVRKGEQRKYHFLPKSEIKKIFAENNIESVDVTAAYADQNWLTTATKAN